MQLLWKKIDASYTVEAAVMVTVFLFTILLGIRICILEYSRVKEEAENTTELSEMNELERIHQMQKIGDVWEVLNGN